MRGSPAVIAASFIGAVLLCGTARASILSGHVQTPEGTPVFNSNQGIFDPATGAQSPTTGDHTDVNGNFAFVVPDGTWELHVVPLIADHLAPLSIASVVVAGDTNAGTIVVPHGFILSGIVTDSLGTPIAGVDIDAVRTADDVKLYTSGDNTDLTGFVDVCVPPGVYNVNINPPQATRLVGRILLNISVASDTSFGTVALQSGFVLSGTVLGPGSVPAVNADIDIRDTFTGAAVRLVGDNTDSLGNFTVVVPPGSVDLAAQPPVATRLVPARILKVDVSADMSVGTITVGSGFAWTGSVTSGGSPVYRADLKTYDSTDNGVPIGDHRTSLAGTFSTIIPGGADDLVVDNDITLGLKRVDLENVNITGDRNDSFALVTSPVTADIVPTTIGVVRGDFVRYSVDLRNTTGASRSVTYVVTGSAFNGLVLRTLVPSAPVTLPAGPGTTTLGPFQNRVPPTLRARFTRVPVRVRLTVTDTGTGTVLDSDFFTFRVY